MHPYLLEKINLGGWLMNKAKLIVDKDFTIAPVDKRLFGTFIEPIGNIVYGNMYNPEHPKANEEGFREDIISLLKELKTTLIRYPGGNYVSGYNWLDGIGPKEERPIRFDKAWRAIDTNQVGIDEYANYMRNLGVESMLTVNLGTGTAEEAANEVEYCNMDSGTYWSDLRRKYGNQQPHGIKLWCLGNEMDGPWQIEQMTPAEYGRKAREAAKMMKWVDPEIELIACGSCTNVPGMKTYPEWDRIVLDNCYEHVDYLSLHRYYSYDPNVTMVWENPFSIEDIAYFSKDLTSYIDTVLAAADFIKGKIRSNKTINISFDEWGIQTSSNVAPKDCNWYEKAEKGAKNVIDAVLFGMFLITFLNRCDRIKIACQSIVIGGMIAADPNGDAYKQTTFYPFQHVATYGYGISLQQKLISPLVTTRSFGEQPAIQSAVIYNEENKEITVFAINLNLREDIPFEADFRSFGNVELIEHIQLCDDQPLAGNTFKNPNRIVPNNMEINKDADFVILPKLSWNVLRYKIK